jgi:two-component system cell cycle response regulator
MARILVIEDNPANLDLMSYLLRAFGHSVLTALDGEAGVEAVLRERPDVVVCDLQIPRLDGFGVARRLKAHPTFRSLPLIAVTAFAMMGDRERVLAAGFDGYLAKPIEPDQFVQRVEAFLGEESAAPPRASAVPERETAAPRVPEATAATILVVDDSPANLDVVRSTLEPLGYRVLTAQSLELALAAARERRPDLILSDVHMRQGDGHALLRAVKSDGTLADIPFVFLSSTLRPHDDRPAGLALGADDFILRPVEPSELVARVEARLHAGARRGGGSETARGAAREEHG